MTSCTTFFINEVFYIGDGMSGKTELDQSKHLMRCPRCRTSLMQSGREPQRHICETCNQHYFLVMQLVPVASDDRSLLLETDIAERGSGSS